MDGQPTEGRYRHPKLGLIHIFKNANGDWVYQCYSDSGSRALSRERQLDQWTWALSEDKGD